ncbi:hypothetical protein PR048_001883 [Dryococelus australis]|uniref:Uncharacterized protein n=1 Tax=Dryococelus australis TaxID=614101 RepID=A0ABQ9IIK1_9NEOP|nr:hypothetical protein PR048_001883 [Dryococelus australis]
MLGGSMMVKWLEHSPPTFAYRARFPTVSLPDLRIWESCRTMPLVGGFSRVSPVSLALAFRCCSVLTTLHPHRQGSEKFASLLIGSQDLDVQSHPNIVTPLERSSHKIYSHALDEFEPINVLQEKENRIAFYLLAPMACTGVSANESIAEAIVFGGLGAKVVGRRNRSRGNRHLVMSPTAILDVIDLLPPTYYLFVISHTRIRRRNSILAWRHPTTPPSPPPQAPACLAASERPSARREPLLAAMADSVQLLFPSPARRRRAVARKFRRVPH